MRISVSFVLIYVTLLFSACSTHNQSNQESLDDLKSYVKIHRDSLEYYAGKSWTTLDSGFTVRKAKLEADLTKMNGQMKESYNSALRDWDAFKNDYNDKSNERAQLNGMDQIRSSLAIDGMRSDFSDLSTSNIVQSYQHFVDVVRDHKDVYTKDQWIVVNVSWKNLKRQTSEIKNDIKTADALKITKLQIEYTTLKAVNRPFAEDDSL